MCGLELLQIKFGVFEYSREATILQVETKSILGRLLFMRVSQELVRQVLRRMKYSYDWLFVLRFYSPVNS